VARRVQADSADDDGEPATQVIAASRVAAIEADPRLPDGILGLAHGSEHSVRDATQVRPLALEFLGEPVPSFHWLDLDGVAGVTGSTEPARRM
jgi:hypothetical protein